MRQTSDPGWTDVEFSERAERHRRELHVHCYRMLGSFDEAEDVVQEVMLQAWRRRGDLEQPEHLRAWLYKIATNRCLDHAPGQQAAGPVAELDARRALARALSRPAAGRGRAGRGRAARGRGRRRRRSPWPSSRCSSCCPRGSGPRLVLRDVLDWPAAEVADAARALGARGQQRPAAGPGHAADRTARRRARGVDQRPAGRPGPRRAGALHPRLRGRRLRHHPGPAGRGHPDHHAAGPLPVRGQGRRPRARRAGPGHRGVAAAAHAGPTVSRPPPAICGPPTTTPSGRTRSTSSSPTEHGTIRAITTFGVKHFETFGLPAVLP